MCMEKNYFDVIVIGAGHAGLEAAWIAVDMSGCIKPNSSLTAAAAPLSAVKEVEMLKPNARRSPGYVTNALSKYKTKHTLMLKNGYLIYFCHPFRPHRRCLIVEFSCLKHCSLRRLVRENS